MSDSRNLLCTVCHQTVEVFELPRQFIDPPRYVCGWCAKHVTPTLLEPLIETRTYDPAIAAIPF